MFSAPRTVGMCLLARVGDMRAGVVVLERRQVRRVAPGQQPLRLNAQDGLPGGVTFRGGGSAPPGAQDAPDGRLADLVPEPGQLTVHPGVPPGWFSPGCT